MTSAVDPSPFAHKDRVHLSWPAEEYGRSVEGAALKVWMPEGRSPRALVFAGIHGNEPESTIVLSAALRAVTPQTLQCAVVLSANPDGALLGLRCNARGVDLNRNFPSSNWGPPAPGELSTGEGPGSEPETQALLSLITRIQPSMVLSIHGDLACVDDPGPTALGTYLAQRSGLTLLPDIGYPTPGSFGTWCAEQKLPVVTLELEEMGTQALRRRWGPILADVLRGQGLGR